MSKPEAGQWWFTNDGSERCYIIGFSTDGEVVVEYEESRMDSDDGDWGKWHHEPHCTGWDWVVPEEPPATSASDADPDEWVEITNPDHVIRKCDQLSDYGTQWYPPSDLTNAVGKTFAQCGFGKVRCRRRDMPKVEQTEPWPKYYTTNTPGENVAFVKRTSMKAYTVVLQDGTEEPIIFREWGAIDDKRRQLTEAEAMALLKKSEPRNRDEALAQLVEEGQKLGMYDSRQPPAKRRVRLWVRNELSTRPSVFVFDECQQDGKYVEIHYDADGFYVFAD